MKVEFSPEADEELIESAAFYESKVVRLGNRFIEEVEQASELLRQRPQIGRLVEGDIRLLTLSQFPFSIIYSIESDRIWIVAVAHQKRRPGYWRDRLSG